MNNIITNLSLNEFENDLGNFNIINEFESEERFTVFFKGLKNVFLFIIDILIKLIAYVTKNLYILLSFDYDTQGYSGIKGSLYLKKINNTSLI